MDGGAGLTDGGAAAAAIEPPRPLSRRSISGPCEPLRPLSMIVMRAPLSALIRLWERRSSSSDSGARW